MKLYWAVVAGGLAAGLWAGSGLLLTPEAASTQESRVASKIVKAADAFLATLTEGQQRRVVYEFGDDEQRARWSNLPISSVKRGGLSLRELSREQRTAAMAVVRAVLSEKGYRKVSEIIDSEAALVASLGPQSAYGADLYFISFLGRPSETAPWMLQFGGHHLGLNLTIVGQENVVTPTLTGANPATFVKEGKTVRPLGEESDRALALVKSLDAAQLEKATLEYRVPDVVLGPGKDGETIVPEGLKVSEMNAEQRKLLMDVVAVWAGLVPDGPAAKRMTEIEQGLGETWFAWSGPVEGEAGKNIGAYYRIQGPKVVIEFAPQGRDGNHIHAMYRDPTNDYGRGVFGR